MKKTSREQANEVLNEYQECKVIEVTTSRTDYPEGLHCGVIGFRTYEDAVNAQILYGGKIVSFMQIEGWQFWRKESIARMPYDILPILLAEYNKVYLYGTKEEYVIGDILEEIAGTINLDDIIKSAQRGKEIIERLDEIDKNDAVCVNGEVIEIRETRPVNYSFDTYKYEIGLEFYGEQ